MEEVPWLAKYSGSKLKGRKESCAQASAGLQEGGLDSDVFSHVLHFSLRVPSIQQTAPQESRVVWLMAYGYSPS